MKTTSAEGNLFPVDAASDEGVSIGHFKEGDTISIQYVEGAWSVGTAGQHHSPLLSPDERVEDRYAWAYPCGIYEMRDGKLELLSLIPTRTKTKPITHMFREECDAYFRSYDPNTKDNSGTVVYRVMIK